MTRSVHWQHGRAKGGVPAASAAPEGPRPTGWLHRLQRASLCSRMLVDEQIKERVQPLQTLVGSVLGPANMEAPF